jgi:predicted dehydrogenase
MKQYRMAVAGFRHAHIFDLYERVKKHPRFALAATCEEDVAHSLLPGRQIQPDFTSFDEMLARVPCDAIALGGCYGDRGALAVQALRAGRHVIADKPLCTSLKELEAIENAVRDTGRKLGLMLDMRDQANLRTLREIIEAGQIGTVQTISAAGQHPLLHGIRPDWYFEPGKHGGTINDIAVHIADFAPWLAGSAIDAVVAARTWNAKAAFAPHFKDCAQFMLRLSSGAGVIGDVSYLAPDGCGYTTPDYWRITVHATKGTATTSWNSQGVSVATDHDSEPRLVAAAPGRPGGYLEDFLAELDGAPKPDSVHTAAVLSASRWALETQSAAS